VSYSEDACGRLEGYSVNNTFKTVFTSDNSFIPDMGSPSSYSRQSKLIITTIGVQKLLEGIDIKKAPGPDNIPNVFLKTFALPLAPLLQNIFVHSLATGSTPNSWRQANVCPV
jgi:hypothetical protein